MLLRTGVDPYEYMDSWERFNENTLRNKNSFYRKFYLENIPGKNYLHAQRVFEEIKSKNVGGDYDLYVQIDILLLADIFENFRNKCIEILELYPVHFSSVPGLALQTCL